MNEDVIIELENFIFDVIGRHEVAASLMADMVGVLIGLKPAMIGDFNKNKIKSSDIDKFEEILDKLGLERVYFDSGPFKHFCISKKIKLAERTHKAFIELWATINNNGEIINKKKWANKSKKIGKLLGYPKTAVDNFAKEDDIENEERKKRMSRNRYYAHSAEHENEEFEAYDLKINRAISELAPKTAKLLSNNKTKRWLD